MNGDGYTSSEERIEDAERAEQRAWERNPRTVALQSEIEKLRLLLSDAESVRASESEFRQKQLEDSAEEAGKTIAALSEGETKARSEAARALDQLRGLEHVRNMEAAEFRAMKIRAESAEREAKEAKEALAAVNSILDGLLTRMEAARGVKR